MQVTRKSLISGVAHTMDLAGTNNQLRRWRAGELIQNVMPHLTSEEREFLISGSMPDEWDEVMRDYEEWDDGHYDDDPNPYHGTYSEE